MQSQEVIAHFGGMIAHLLDNREVALFTAQCREAQKIQAQKVIILCRDGALQRGVGISVIAQQTTPQCRDQTAVLDFRTAIVLDKWLIIRTKNVNAVLFVVRRVIQHLCL